VAGVWHRRPRLRRRLWVAFCNSSIECRSGERMKAILPSRGGRLIVTPIFISLVAGRIDVVDTHRRDARIAISRRISPRPSCR